jgi:hypothetical protein
MMTKETTEVAVKKAAELAMAAALQEDAGAGFEEASSTSYAIPFLQILQSGSPQCKKSDGAYIKGAEEGMFYNTVTQELYEGEKGVEVIPCHFSQRMVEWKPRESGGGFVGEHQVGESPSTIKDDKGRDILPNGNTLVDTRNHYVLIKTTDGSLTPAIIAMTSTQLKKSRQWMSKMQGIKIKDATGAFVTAPMMSRSYKLTTSAESNDKGSWFGFRIELNGLVEDISEYRAAQEFRSAVRQGQAQAKYKEAEEEDDVNKAF